MLSKGKTMEKTLNFRGNLIRAGGDAKTIKGNGEYLTAILYMTPYKTLGANLCPMAETAGCLSGCLNTAGRGAMNSVQRGRARKAEWFVRDRASFMAQLDTDLSRFLAYCRKRGVQPAVRLNGTTDIQWELIKDDGGRNVFQRWPEIRFYDYTKIANRSLNIPNYNLTFSYSEASGVYLRQAQKAVARGMNVAVVFRDKESIPATFSGRRVVDGDKNDLRFLDPRNVIVALYAKGKAKKDTSGFVIDYAPAAYEVAA
jgi:hypothetical protein